MGEATYFKFAENFVRVDQIVAFDGATVYLTSGHMFNVPETAKGALTGYLASKSSDLEATRKPEGGDRPIARIESPARDRLEDFPEDAWTKL